MHPDLIEDARVRILQADSVQQRLVTFASALLLEKATASACGAEGGAFTTPEPEILEGGHPHSIRDCEPVEMQPCCEALLNTDQLTCALLLTCVQSSWRLPGQSLNQKAQDMRHS